MEKKYFKEFHYCVYSNRQTEFIEIGRWYNKYPILISTKEEIEEYNGLINNIIQKSPTTTIKDRVYLGVLSDLPRHKIKDYLSLHNASKTSKINYASTIILNKVYLKELQEIFKDFKFREIYEITDKEDLDYIQKDINLGRNSSTYNIYEEISPDIKYEVIIDITDYKDKYISPILINKTTTKMYSRRFYRDEKMIILLDLLDYIKSNPNINIILDEDVLCELNKDSIELDEEYLNTLDNMFESRDQDNINIALEMLSNIDIEKYLLTVSLFLNKHYEKFNWGSGITMNNNRSFKSILTYLKNKDINCFSDWRTFTAGLLKNFQNDPKSTEIITEFIRQNLNNILNDVVYGSLLMEIDNMSIRLK